MHRNINVDHESIVDIALGILQFIALRLTQFALSALSQYLSTHKASTRCNRIGGLTISLPFTFPCVNIWSLKSCFLFMFNIRFRKQTKIHNFERILWTWFFSRMSWKHYHSFSERVFLRLLHIVSHTYLIIRNVTRRLFMYSLLFQLYTRYIVSIRSQQLRFSAVIRGYIENVHSVVIRWVICFTELLKTERSGFTVWNSRIVTQKGSS